MNETSPAGSSSAPPLPRGSRVDHKVDIAAPAEFVWQYFERVDDWPSWNPIYRKAKGSIRTGDTLDLFVAIPGMKAQDISATVSLSMPPAHLRYGSPALAGLIRALRFVEVEAAGPESCIVTNGEVMGGVLGSLIGPTVAGKVLEALRQMNEGLKAAAESQWRERE